jgi:hypothetical protein
MAPVQVVELLDHENVDVALAAVDLIHELTDPEALMEAEEEEGAKVLSAATPAHAAHNPPESCPPPASPSRCFRSRFNPHSHLAGCVQRPPILSAVSAGRVMARLG